MIDYKDSFQQKDEKTRTIFDFHYLFRSSEIVSYHENKITFTESEIKQAFQQLDEYEPPLTFISAMNLIKYVISDPNLILSFNEKIIITYIEMFRDIMFQRQCLIIFNLIFQVTSQLNCLNPIIESDFFNILEKIILQNTNGDYESFCNACSCFCYICESSIKEFQNSILNTKILEFLKNNYSEDPKFNKCQVQTIIRVVKSNWSETNFDPIEFFSECAVSSFLKVGQFWPGYGAQILAAFIDKNVEISGENLGISGFFQNLMGYLEDYDLDLRNSGLLLLSRVTLFSNFSSIFPPRELIEKIFFIFAYYPNEDSIKAICNLIENSNQESLKILLETFPYEALNKTYSECDIKSKSSMINISESVTKTKNIEFIEKFFNSSLINDICDLICLQNDEYTIKIIYILDDAIKVVQNNEFTSRIADIFTQNDIFDELDNSSNEKLLQNLENFRKHFISS